MLSLFVRISLLLKRALQSSEIIVPDLQGQLKTYKGYMLYPKLGAFTHFHSAVTLQNW